jgi:hypothetical protein
MKNGILREDEGYDLLVDGKERTFRDVYENALGAARELKRNNLMSLIEIRDRATGNRQIMLENGSIAST